MRSEEQIRQQIEKLAARRDDPKSSRTLVTLMHIRIETLQWALGEIEGSFG